MVEKKAEKSPDVSVVLPAYNAAGTISATIESVLNQSFAGFELLIINDGSSDQTVTIVEAYAARDSRVRLFSQENKGANAARMQGVELAIGTYVTFIDADDSFLPDCLKAMYTDIIGYDLLVTRGKEAQELDQQAYLTATLDHLLPKELWGKLFKPELLSDWVMTLPRSLVIGEDFVWNIRMAKNVQRVKVVTDNYYQYRMGDASSLMQQFEKNMAYEANFYAVLEQSLADMGLAKTEIFKLLTAQRFYSFFGIVYGFKSIDYNDAFLQFVARPSRYLKEKVNMVLYSIMLVPFLRCKVFLLKRYIKLRGL